MYINFTYYMYVCLIFCNQPTGALFWMRTPEQGANPIVYAAITKDEALPLNGALIDPWMQAHYWNEAQESLFLANADDHKLPDRHYLFSKKVLKEALDKF